MWQLLRSNYVNVLLVVVPFGLLSGALSWDPVVRFTLNFLAIIPLQSLMSYASEELSLSLGQILGGLLNTVLGSATELIVRLALSSPSSHRSDLLLGKYFRLRSKRDSNRTSKHNGKHFHEHATHTRRLFLRGRS